MRHAGLVMNNFSAFGHYIGFVPASGINKTGVLASNSYSNTVNKSQMKNAFREFALVDSEIVKGNGKI